MGIFKQSLDDIAAKNRKAADKRQLKLRETNPKAAWPESTREDVVKTWLMTGSLTEASKITGVPYKTCRNWKQEAWWIQMERELRLSENLLLDQKLSEIIKKSLEATLDRVENGDFIYDQKTGEIRRRPAALRDLHKVAVDVLGKRELVRDKQAERKEGTETSVEDHLKLLADKMAQWFEKEKKPIIELTEVEDAVYVDRSKPGTVESVPEGEVLEEGGDLKEEPKNS